VLSLQEISDQMEIRRLTVAYAHAIDTRNFDLLDDVFTADAILDYSAIGGAKGLLSEIKPWLAKGLSKYLLGHQHLISNHDIRIDGDRGTGRIMCFNPMPMKTPEGEQIRFDNLWYDDLYLRTPVGWRISQRTEDPAFSQFWPIQK
jgi:hypothetical protein